jgi:hypothetical protein
VNYDILPNIHVSEYPKILVSRKVPGIIIYINDVDNIGAVFCIKTDKNGNIPKVLHSHSTKYVDRHINNENRWGWSNAGYSHGWATLSGKYQCWYVSFRDVTHMYDYIDEQLYRIESIYKHNKSLGVSL